MGGLFSRTSESLEGDNVGVELGTAFLGVIVICSIACVKRFDGDKDLDLKVTREILGVVSFIG